MDAHRRLILFPVLSVLILTVVASGCSQTGRTVDTAAPSFCPTGSEAGLAVPLDLPVTSPRAYYQSLSVPEGGSLSITLYACDPDQPDTSAGLAWSVILPPAGQLSAQSGTYPDAVITYDAVQVPAGTTDSFWYYVTNADGEASNTAEVRIAVTTPGPVTGIDPAKVAGIWFGPARMDPATDLDVPIPGVIDFRIFGSARVSIDGAGNVTAIDINGQNFSSIGNSWQADFGVLDGDRLAHLDFPNAPSVPAGFLTTVFVPAVEGGGLLFDQPVTAGAGAPPQHAFLYIHDKYGTDLVIAALQRDATTLPLYVLDDVDSVNIPGGTTWSGFTAEFQDFTGANGVPLDLRFQAYRNWSLTFENTAVAGMNITGSINDAGVPVTITSGSMSQVAGTGYFEGSMNGTDWTLRLLMSPDKQFMAGFSWFEPWTGRWHDVALTRQ